MEVRRRRWAPPAPSRPSYYSHPTTTDGTSFLSSHLPTLIIIGSFLAGWLLGREEFARTMAVKLTMLSSENIQSTWDTILIFAGLAVHKECISEDGVENVAFCSVPQLMGKLMRERDALRRRMESNEEYGSYYHHIFSDANTKPVVLSEQMVQEYKKKGSTQHHKQQNPLFLASSATSKRKLIRRILIKHTQAVIREKSVNDLPPPTFTWITAGDSTAAGHGNLFLQSYTAILQETVESAFRSLGIRFVAKNYGMGQYSSGPELALCMNEVFGHDIDALMWDFASLQPILEPLHRTVLWGNRAGMHLTRPILFSFDSFGDRFIKMRDLDVSSRMSAILMDAESMQKLRQKLPDSDTVDDPLVLPEALRYYLCDGTVEGAITCDDPMRNFICYLEEDMLDGREMSQGPANPKVCQKNKFRTKPECIDARYKVSWHPGWKDHMLKGRLLGHFLINIIDDALFELERLKSVVGSDPKNILSHLERMDEKDKDFFQKQPPDIATWKDKGDISGGMDPETVLRGQSICHTALLPSKSRLEGITTLSDLVGDEHDGFDKGFNQFVMRTPEDGLLPLAYDMNDRQQCNLLEVDHKDFLLVREQDGWVSTTVPNERELEVYKRTSEVEGIIVICLKICPLNKCPDVYVSIDEVSKRSKLFIKVDGKVVHRVQKLDGCNVLVGEKGIRWGKKDQFELSFRINKPGTLHVMKISSIIVF